MDNELELEVDQEILDVFRDRAELPSNVRINYGGFHDGDVVEDSIGKRKVVYRPDNPEERY